MTLFSAASRIALNGSRASLWAKNFSVDSQADQADVTVIEDEWKRSAVTLQSWSASISGIYEQAEFEYLKDEMQSVGYGNVLFAPAGWSAQGDVCVLGEVTAASVSRETPREDVVQASIDLQGHGSADFGVILLPLTELSASVLGTAFDGGAQTTNGAVLHLHFPLNTRNGSTTVAVEHSTSAASGYTPLGTFTVVNQNTVYGSQRLVVDGTVKRYVRVNVTVAGTEGATHCVVGIARR